MLRMIKGYMVLSMVLAMMLVLQAVALRKIRIQTRARPHRRKVQLSQVSSRLKRWN